MSIRHYYLAAAIMAVSISSPTFAAFVIPVTGTIRNQVYAFEDEKAFESNGSAVVKNDAWLLVPTDLASSAVATHYPTAGGFEGVSQNVSAVWNSSDAGSVKFDFQSLIINPANLDLDSADEGFVFGEGIVTSRWTYRFIASADSLLTIALSADSDYSGPDNSGLSEYNAGAFYVNGDDKAETRIWPQQNDFFDTASYSIELNAGEEYSLEFDSKIDLREPTGTSVYNASQMLTFAVGARPVITPPDDPGNSLPEPTSWSMLVGGFALAGGALRRRVTRTIPA